VLVPNGFEKLGDLPKFAIGEDLLQGRLRKEHLVLFVVLVRSIHNLLSRVEVLNNLSSNFRDALIVLVELDSVSPARLFPSTTQENLNRDVRAFSRCEATQGRDSTTIIDSLCEAIFGEVVEKSKRVEEVGLSRGVGAN